MPGRKRKPAALREGELNQNGYSSVAHRSIPAEPNFPTGIKCPSFLDREAKREWRRITTALAEIDLLRQTDTGVLGSYCAAYSRWCKAEKTLATDGPILKVVGSMGQTKYVKHPALMISEQSQKMMLRAGSLLGFNPSDRTKVSAPPKQAKNPFASLDDDEPEENT